MVRTNYYSSLTKYVNTGCINKIDLISSGLLPSFPFNQNAAKLCGENKLFENKNNTNQKSVTVPIAIYNGNNSHVTEMMNFIDKNLKNDLYGAYVHGSLATGEEIKYSDFDGIAILSADTINNPRKLSLAAQNLSKAYSMMIGFDPLQHHGWFILSEMDLQSFPMDYFPVVLFDHSRSLMQKGTVLNYQPVEENHNFKNNLKRLVTSVNRKLIKEMTGINMFRLKAILSEFMLLPSLYIEAKTGKGIYKKFSFSEARKDFDPDAWAVMDEVSEIRNQWTYEPAWRIRKTPVLVTPWLKMEQAAKAGPVKPLLKQQLSAAFLKRMSSLSKQMLIKAG
jgi:hypothetical protein